MNCISPTVLLNILFVITDLPKPACQNCPSVEEAPAMKTVLDAFCQHDFGKFWDSFTTLWFVFSELFLSFKNHIINLFFSLSSPQLWLPNFIVVAYPRESQNLRSRAGLSLSARDLCCLMTPSTYSSSGCWSTVDVPVSSCVLEGHSFMCWPVLCSSMAPLLSPVSSHGTKKMQTSRWPLASGSTTDVKWTHVSVFMIPHLKHRI